MNEEERSFYKHAMKMEVDNLKAVNVEEKEEVEATARSEEDTTEAVETAERDEDTEDVVMAPPAPPKPTMAPAEPLKAHTEKREEILKKIVYLRKKENEAMNQTERSFYEEALQKEIDNLTAVNQDEKDLAEKELEEALPSAPTGEEAVVEPSFAAVLPVPAAPQMAPAAPLSTYVEKREQILKKIVFLRQKESEAMYTEEREFFEKSLKMEIANLKALSDEEKNAGKKKEEKAEEPVAETPSENFVFSGETYQAKRETVIKSIVVLRKQESEAMNASQRALVQKQLDHEVKRLVSLTAEEKELMEEEEVEE